MKFSCGGRLLDIRSEGGAKSNGGSFNPGRAADQSRAIDKNCETAFHRTGEDTRP